MKTKASYISVHSGQVFFFFFGREGSDFDAKWITEKILVLGVRIMDEGLETCTQIIVLLLSSGSLLILAPMEVLILIFFILTHASLSYWIIRFTWWVHVLNHVRLFATPGTVAHQVVLSVEFLQTIYWSGVPFPSPEDLPDPRIKPMFNVSPALQADSLPAEPLGKPKSPL